MTSSEAEERARLETVKTRIQHALQDSEARLHDYARDIEAQKHYLWDSRADMDHIEKISARQSIEQSVMTGEAVLAQQKRLLKLARSPYFGRFDFARTGSTPVEAIYVGVHHFHDEHAKHNLVYDWRAPISTMFYDYETGPARYESPAGAIHGELTLKRQCRIRDGRMEFMLESAVNIMDDVLQQELSRAADAGMKNIVATIQRDQNAIIRDARAPVLIIQGVAGSGKTSIALHRIAFLLYRFKDSLTSNNILIISPNRVFGDYIANVLPELGEESVAEIGMETLADEWLDSAYRFETFLEQTSRLLEKDDEALRRRIALKASPDFLKKLDAYAAQVESTALAAEDVWIGRRLAPAWFIEETFRKQPGVATTERIAWVVKAIEQNFGIYYRHDLTTEERGALRTALRKMVRRSTLRETYKNLFVWLGQPELFKPAKGGRLEYADVFPMIYLKLRLEGIQSARRAVKHLLIDEMQDYTPVQYAVIARLFGCQKTILGDANQAVDPYSTASAAEIQRIFMQASCVKLTKSYRSTFEITRFAQGISPDPDLVAIERHGAAPQVVRCRNLAEENARIGTWLDAFAGSDHHTLAILCKTQKQAERRFAALRAAGHDIRLLDARSRAFARGVIICTAHLAKGLEFDRVIVPDASAKNYTTPMDRNLLYVACTRAMHELVLTHIGERTPFIPE